YFTYACSYVGAIYEHEVIGNVQTRNSKDIIKMNLDIYDDKVAIASKKGAKIIVFPEYGITGYYDTKSEMSKFVEVVPDIVERNYVNPCNNQNYSNKNHYILHTLSCMAKKNKIFIVANMGELQLFSKNDQAYQENKNPYLTNYNFNICTPFPENYFSSNNINNSKQYNTDIVFDSNGNLIAKYRKCHLCYELNYDYPDKCELITFNTDFAGLFGIFTCFDINWKNPAIDIVVKNGLKNMVFPTSWPDLVPFLTANGVQSSYAIRMGVNFLAANTRDQAKYGARGSGIYSGDLGALDYIYDYTNIHGGHLLISELPCTPGNSSQLTSNKKLFSPVYVDLKTLSQLGRNFSTEDEIKTPHSRHEKLEENIQEREKTNNLEITITSNAVIDDLKVKVFGPTRFSQSSPRDELDKIFGMLPEPEHVNYVVIYPPSNKNDYEVVKKASKCMGNLCCHMTYKFAKPSNFTHKTKSGVMLLVVYNMLHREYVNWFMKICAFNQCPTSDLHYCGNFGRDATHTFSYFKLTGNFSTEYSEKSERFPKKADKFIKDDNQTYVFPIVLVDGAYLPDKSQWNFTHKNTIEAPLGFSKPLFSAALWGRDYGLDNKTYSH
ncbi:unnamed protein product, partial [Gordionus sp. m RMFG-2023]